MSDKTAACQILKRCLPNKKIVWKSLKLQRDTFLDPKLNTREVDALFSVKIGNESGYIYLLAEHQRKKDKQMAQRLEEYRVRIAKRHREKHKTHTSPLVYPLVFYNGVEPWQATSLLDSYPAEQRSEAKRVLLEPFQLIDVRELSPPDPSREPDLALLGVMQSMRYQQRVDYMCGLAKQFKAWRLSGRSLLIEAVVCYNLFHFTEEERQSMMSQLQQNLPSEQSEPFISAAEGFFNDGVEKGISQGEKLGAQKIAKAMYQLGISIENISLATSLTLEDIETLIKR